MYKLQQKEKTKSLADRTDDIMKSVERLKDMPKFPAEPAQLEFWCGILASFIQTVEVFHGRPDDPELQRPDDMGWVNPMEWVVKQVAATCIFFPMPIQWRKIYEQKFRPLDGRYASSIELMLEE